MTGYRLITGLVSMGIVVPLLLSVLLGLHGVTEIFIVSATCFSAWGVTDLVAQILSRPRLRDRSPGDALKNIDLTTKQAQQRQDGGEPAP